jgi:uncharacterized membrane protein YedE/YeeE
MEFILGAIGIGIGILTLIFFNGRILGISGIIRGFLQSPFQENGWRFFLIVGLIISPIFYSLSSPLPTFEIITSPAILVIAGLLVGVGASLSNGCTSGHSVCGVSRLSPRSIVATLIMMATAFMTFNLIKFLF